LKTELELLNELRNEPSTNNKITILKSASTELNDIDTIKTILSFTYDKNNFKFGLGAISVQKALDRNIQSNIKKNISTLLNDLTFLFPSHPDRKTGNCAIDFLAELFSFCENDETRNLFAFIVSRDLKIGMGRTQINKVFKDLIKKKAYCRCGIATDKNIAKFDFSKKPFLQLKADGSYLECVVDNHSVVLESRSGEDKNKFSSIADTMKNFDDGVYVGEVLVLKDGFTFSDLDKKPLVECILDRGTANGILNRLEKDIPQDRLFIFLWDKIDLIEYLDSKHKDKSIVRKTYSVRFEELENSIISHSNDNVRIIKTYRVDSFTEATSIVSDIMKSGLEGAILKSNTKNNFFKDHTNQQQLKMKISFSLDVIVTGFVEGKKGTKREHTFGSLTYETVDGKLKGSVSGFKDSELIDINNNRENTIGRIIEIEGNDITLAKDSDIYAVSHPRFISFRNKDISECDTIERALEQLDMAKLFL
jgi:hypothetical protein